MSAGPGRERVDVAIGEEFAVLKKVGAVGVQRIAGQAALELQVGEEIEDKALEAGLGAWGIGDDHGGGFSLSCRRP